MQDRVLDAADILVDRHPVVGSPRGRTAPSRSCGEVKRSKYQDESTKVSSVSVSRRAGLPQGGQATCFQVGWRSSGLPGRSNVDVVGQHDRQVLLRHRHDAAACRNGSPGSGSPSSAGARPASRAGGTAPCPCRRPRFQPRDDARLASSTARPSRKSELMIAPSSTKASSATSKVRRPRRRQHHRNDRQAVLARELEVALVVARAAEDRAGAVVHQHEVGDIDRQRLARRSTDASRRSRCRSRSSRPSRSRPPRCRSCGIRRRSAAGLGIAAPASCAASG